MIAAFELCLVSSLRETELMEQEHMLALAANILKTGYWTTPICVERTTLAVMDGHHRLAAAKKLGLTHVPCAFFTYDKVSVYPRREGYDVTPAEILRRARDRDLYPIKTTHHIFPNDPPACLVPLEQLRSKILSQVA